MDWNLLVFVDIKLPQVISQTPIGLIGYKTYRNNVCLQYRSMCVCYN